jgi:hypothetical protein
MRRSFFCGVAMAVFAIPCPAAEQTTSTAETLIRLSVSPAPAPRPALRYRLLPELREMNPGNPIAGYMRCMLEQQRFFFDKEAFERREELLAMPLKELPALELEEYGRLALRHADRAARLDNPDWQVLLKLKSDGINLLLPEVQQIRSVARALAVRFRSEIALGRFDDAIRTAKTLFAMSRHLSEHPTLIADLVAISAADTAIGPLEEMLQQPGCPNLYWALTNLPAPLVPLDRGMEGERVMSLSPTEFGELDEKAPMTADQIKSLIAKWDVLLGDGKPLKPGESPVRAWLDARTADENKVGAARHRLAEHGLAREQLLRFPADQVILVDQKHEYDARFDDLMKTMKLPAWQAQELAGQPTPSGEPSLFADALVNPGVFGVHRKRWLLDQRIALLRHVEALRLHAAEHDGTLPRNLSEVSVPLPDDPLTGKPFRYELAGDTAHLRGQPPAGTEANADFNLHYEVTLRK